MTYAPIETKMSFKRSIVIGVFAVLSVLGIGVGVAFATGFVTPDSVTAAFGSDGPCCGGGVTIHLDGGGGGGGGGWDGGGGGGGYEPPEPPECELSASPSTVSPYGQTTLSWTTANATSATINQGVGAVTPIDGGSTSVQVGTQTITYTMTVTGMINKWANPRIPTVTCSTTVIVTTPVGPTCTLSANPHTIPTGGATTLTWTTTNATQISIDEDVDGPLVPIAGGSITAHPTDTTTYHFTASGPGGEVECTDTVVVEPPPPGKGCIRVLKETYNTYGDPLTPVAQFAFMLDGGAAVYNDASGNAVFTNVTPGAHQVTENVPATWTQLSVTPALGNVMVSAGETCSAVVFKNKQVLPPGECVLEITKSADSEHVVAGGQVEYTISFQNIGTANCTGGGVRVYDVVDSRLTYVSETHSANVSAGYSGPVWNAGDRTLRWNAHDLTPGESGWVKWKATVASPSECTETVPNKAKITAKELNNFETWVESNTVNVEIAKESCSPPEPVRIKATKIVCDAESDLPNYGAGGPNITETTATDYVANHPGCHLESGWTFEWANGGTANPGDNVEVGGAGWTPFGPTDASGVATVNIDSWTGDKIWVREQLKNDYIPFKGTVMDNVSAELYCHTDVLNYDNFDFITNPQLEHTYYCVAWNKQKPPPPGTPQCTLSADPSSIESGESSTLTWTTTNVTSATINQSVGAVTPVAGGTVEVSPTENTTYTLTGNGPGGEVTCTTEVNIRIAPPTPVCSLSADKGSIEDGDEVTLSWTSAHTNELFFNQGIGSTTPITGGTLVVSPDDDITYTGTWYSEGAPITCSVSIAVDEQGKSCEMNVSPSSINKGENASLSWGGTNVTGVSIDNGIGSKSVPGSETVSPSEPGTYTYHGEFTSADEQVIHCSTTLEVVGTCTENCGGGGGGGGRHNPRVTFKALPQPEGEVLGSYVYLSQVPYTGLDLGPLGTVFYWLMLAVWSAAAAYLVLFNLLPFTYRRFTGFGKGMHAVLNQNAMTPAPAYATPVSQTREPSFDLPGAFTNAMHVFDEVPEAPRGYSTYKGFRSFADNNKLTVDDVVRGLARTEEVPEATYAPVQNPVMQSVADAYDANSPHPAYDAWKSAQMGNNVEPIYTSVEPIYENVEPIAPSIPRPAYMNVGTPKGADAHGIHDADVHGFLDALLSADREATFGFLRQMTRSGIAVEKFLTRALHALDDSFRARVEGGTCDPEVLRITGKCTTPTLETLVASLTHAVDGSYSQGMTGAKLALTRALDAVEN